MKFGVVNKSTTVNRFFLHILQRNITNLAVVTSKTNIKRGILKGRGKLEKSRNKLPGTNQKTIRAEVDRGFDLIQKRK